MTRKIVLNEDIRRWRSECPLYAWKRAKPGRLKVLMTRLPVSKSGIFAWLHGIALPRPELMLELEKFTHISPKAWLLWWCDRPKGPDGTDDRFGLQRAANPENPPPIPEARPFPGETALTLPAEAPPGGKALSFPREAATPPEAQEASPPPQETPADPLPEPLALAFADWALHHARAVESHGS